MRRLETLIPPPVVAAVLALLMWLAAPSAARTLAAPIVGFGLALVVALAGGAIAAAGARSFRRAGTTISPHRPGNASVLVTRGIYRATRNPMYLGLALVLAGVAVWLWWWPAIVGPIAFVAYITRFQIVPEERALGARFGAAYEAYRRRVRRWL